MPILSEEAVEFCTNLFKKADTDNSGSIDKSELEVTLTKISQKEGFKTPSKEEIDAQFAAIDTSGDGKIDLKEFLQFVTFIKVMMICAVLFEAVDDDKSGSIDKSELKALLTKLYESRGLDPPSDEKVGDYVKKLDASGDGSIDFGEFASFMVPIIVSASR